MASSTPPRRPLPPGLKVGLEIHQQLDTPKLFCSCPSELAESTDLSFDRVLRPTASELGEVDRAAVAEARRRRRFGYEAPRAASCLVEMDEEPPHALTPEAVEVALSISLLLNMRSVDEIHVMRKIVIDGSNTSGFQRTALLSSGGHVDTPHGRVGIATLCLEEDAARKMGEADARVLYRLDRLGIPLVEIATDPQITSPEGAREVAEAIGWALRSTGRVKRGLGTIRQDLNVSIAGGARIELKGVQELRILPLAVEYEARRQARLLAVGEELRRRGVRAESLEGPLVDLTSMFSETESKVVRPVLDRQGVVLALSLPGFASLLGGEGGAKEGPRLGRELADYAIVAAGVKGLFHSDELPAYGITEADVVRVRERLRIGPPDAFALVAAAEPVARKALEAARERAIRALDGVPEETRDAADDGSSRYLRPLPGGARMYPETDVPPMSIERPLLERVRAALPELIPAKAERFSAQYGLSSEEARVLARGRYAATFEILAGRGQAREAARVFLHVLPEVGEVPEPVLMDLFDRLAAGAFSKEALPPLLAHLARGNSVADALAQEGLAGGGPSGQSLDVRAEVDRVIAENAALVASRGAGAAKPLMGTLMQRFRGKVSGELLAKTLDSRIQAFLDRQSRGKGDIG